jgi:stress response protein YsnF
MGYDHLDLLRRDAVSSDGAKLGHVADVYVDARTGAPKWLVVQGGMFSSGASFVPAEGARSEDERLVVAYTRRQVRRAPHPAADGDLTGDEEAALARYYLDQASATTPTETGRDETEPDGWLADPTTTSDESVVRAEEELEVDRSPRPVQRARLVKRVVTEDVTFTVPLRREVLRVEYENIDDDEADVVARTDGREPFSPLPEQEIVLYAEVVEYEKKVVPRERVRLQHEVAPDVVDLRTGIRKEHVDVSDAPTP